MHLLIVTQKVDMNDPVLGFFHRWLEEFSKKYEKIIVIALGVGEYKLPDNVRVLSLGKENLKIKNCKLEIIKNFIYLLNFYRYIWQEHSNYDTVFVHMNQEYVILGWKLWRILGKKIWLWRNHPKGSVLTNIAVWMSDRVFCTSKYSYTARFKKTKIMPVGIDTGLFERKLEIKRVENSILSLGRIAPIKNIDLLIEALNILNKEKFNFNVVIVGDAREEDGWYYEFIKNKVVEYGLENKIYFRKAVPPSETVDLYNSSELFINLTPTGSMDKTMFEAMACETLILTSNQSLEGLIDNALVINENNAIQIALKIKKLISLKSQEKEVLCEEVRNFVLEKHSLEKLIASLS